MDPLLQRLFEQRVLVVVAHPDDETVGAGGLLPWLRDASLLCVTDGAPRNLMDAYAAGCATREEYAVVRAAELVLAMRLAGIGSHRIHFAGFADQAASYHLEEATDVVLRQIRRHQPEMVLTQPYEGGHPDHDATAFAVHAAMRLLEEAGEPTPELIEMSAYHAGPAGMVTGEFLACDSAEPVVLTLSPVQRALKQSMLNCHSSQRNTLAQFTVDAECYRYAPTYDFTRPPHSGQLWYERFDWGITGTQWREQANRALRRLTLQSVPELALL